MNSKNLQNKAYYEDLYDHRVVNTCRTYDIPYSRFSVQDKKKIPESEWNRIAGMHLYIVKGEMYLEREDQIAKWMERDKKRDEHFDRVQILMKCDICDQDMELFDKSLEIDYEGKEKDYVQFTFGCRKCKRYCKIDEYGNKKVETIEAIKCPKCNGEIKSHCKKTKKKNIYQDICTKCKWKDPHPLTIQHYEEKEDEEKKEKFKKDKKKYCLTPEQGREYLAGKERMNRLSDLFKEIDAENTEGTLRNKLKKLQMLTIAQLKKKLIKSTEKERFSGLEFKHPTDERLYVSIEFSLQDEDDERTDYESRNTLKRLVKKKLLKTNWSLVTDSICYRMGILTGKIRGTQNEEKLMDLIQKREDKEGLKF